MEMGSAGCVFTELGHEQLAVDSIWFNSKRYHVLLWNLQLLGEFSLHGVHVSVHPLFHAERS